MQAAVLDACVLYSAPMRDFFMRLAVELFQPKWTQDIHDEWIRNVLLNRPDLTRVQLERTRELMDRHGGDCLVRGYKHLIPSLTLPDKDDRHVLASAIVSKASSIITFNLSDFPDSALAEYGVQAVHPDDFASRLYAVDSNKFIALVRQHRMALVNPRKTSAEYLATLQACGLEKTALRLQAHLGDI